MRAANRDWRGVSRAVILAAGRGSRLQSLTDDMPKCLVEIGGTPLLMRTLGGLAEQGLDEAVIVIGYGGDTVRERVGESYAGLAIHYVEAPDFASTNNIRSLWDARRYLDQDLLLLEADVVFDAAVGGALLEVPGSSAAVAPFQRPLSGTVVHCNAGDYITSFTLGADQGPGFDADNGCGGAVSLVKAHVDRFVPRVVRCANAFEEEQERDIRAQRAAQQKLLGAASKESEALSAISWPGGTYCPSSKPEMTATGPVSRTVMLCVWILSWPSESVKMKVSVCTPLPR